MRVDVPLVLNTIIQDIREICDNTTLATAEIPVEQLQVMHDDLVEVVATVEDSLARLRAYIHVAQMLKKLMEDSTV